MGTKDDKLTNASAEFAKKLQDHLLPLGEINLRKMFGGHGIFFEDKMFALVDSQGTIFFKVDERNISLFQNAGS